MIRGGADLRRLLAAACLGIAAMCVLAGIARAEPRIGSLRLGVSGAYRIGRWSGAEVRLSGFEHGGDVRVSLTAADESGRPVRYDSVQRLTAGSQIVNALVRIGDTSKPLVVSLADAAGRSHVERSFTATEYGEPFGSSAELVVVVGRLPGLDAVQRIQPDPERRLSFQQISGLSQLPNSDNLGLTDRVLTLDAVRTVVWMAGQSTGIAVDAATRTRLRTLDDWVRAGGRLILSVDGSADVDRDSLAFEYLSEVGSLSGATEIRQAAPLETYIGREPRADSSQREARGDAPAFRLPIVRFTPREGTPLASTGQGTDGTPLVVRVPRGFGEVLIVAFDLADPGLLAWPGHTRLVGKVLADPEADAPHSPTKSESSNAWTHKGYASLDSQLADALDQFPGTSPDLFWYLAAAAVAYILVIGPIDWYIVRRQPEWTWATFLVTVLGAAAGAYGIVQATKSDRPLVSQLCFVDVDLTTRGAENDAAARVRSSAWTRLYEPTAGVADVRMSFPWPRPNLTNDAGSTSANNLRIHVGSGSGPARGGSLFARPTRSGADAAYRVESGQVLGVARPAWSSELFVGESLDDTPFMEVASLTPDAFGRVWGSVRNPLDESLEQAVLFYGNSALSLGNIAPGATVAVDGRGDWRSVEAYLTRRRMSEDRESAERYDPTSADLDRIGEIIGFYAAAGGERYAGLKQGETSLFDMTAQLKLGRAVLMGKTNSGASIVLRPSNEVEGDTPDVEPDRQVTWWRYLIKVAKPK
jgi:hypothetical protein